MNLLFITHSDLTKRSYGDGSTRYRCFNVAEVALARDHSVQVMQLDAVRIRDLERYDLISWSRPVPGRKAFAILDRAAALNIPCIADVDDLIFDPSLAAESPAVVNGFALADSIEKRFARHASMLRHFNAMTVSTTCLAQHASTHFTDMDVATIHNGLSTFWLAHADVSLGTLTRPESLGYLPGTRSHDQDLASICLPLNQWLLNRPQASLDIVGKIAIAEKQLPRARVRHHPWVDYYQLPALMRQHCACLAPLTLSRFNAAKSHVKFIESASLGIPLVASPNADLRQHDCPGLLFAETPQEWFDTLMRVSEPGYQTRNAAALQSYARTFCTAERYAKPLIQAWEQGCSLPTQRTHASDISLARVA